MPKKLRIIRNKKTAPEEPQQTVPQEPQQTVPEEKNSTFTIENMSERVEDLEDSESDDIDFDQEVKKLLGIRQVSQAPQYFTTRKQVVKQGDIVLENSETIVNTMTRVPSEHITTQPVGSRASKVSNRC
jgi:hypothetical protein